MKHSKRIELARAWKELFRSFPFNYAITLTYNPQTRAAALPCWRCDKETTERKHKLPKSGSRWAIDEPNVSLDRVRADLDALHCRVDRQIMGARFNRLPSENRSNFIAAVEHNTSNIHIHLLWHTPLKEGVLDDLVRAAIVEAWACFTPRGEVEFIKAFDPEGWADYSTKDQWQPDGDNLVFSRSLSENRRKK